MSSPEDTSPLTVTPSANGEASPDEAVCVSAEPVAVRASPLPADSSDETGEGQVPEGVTKPLPQVNAVAHEVRVRVTGARPGGDSGERDLFSENTTTVLVFEKGGVIRLAAAVAPGQLLFLTNEHSQKEVVAQVVRKRAFRPTECYVELEFTEPAPQFWGMEFSAATSLLPKDEEEVKAAELVASAETSTDDPGDTTPAPNTEEVITLKKEVEALRGQLKLLQKANTPEEFDPAAEVKAVVAEPAEEVEVKDTAAESAPVVYIEPAPTVGKELALEATGAKETLGMAPEVPLAASDAPLNPPFFPKSLPLDRAPLSTGLVGGKELALPKPQFDFSNSLPKPKKRSFRARGNFTPGFRSGILRMALLSVALVGTVVGAAWYKHWLPWKPAAKRIEVASWTGPTTTPSAVEAAPPAGKAGSTAIADAHTGKGKATGAADRPNTEVPLTITVHENLPETEVAKEIPEPTERPTSRGGPRSLGKRQPAHEPEATPGIAPVSVAAEDATVVPPKLIRSAKAVASLDDLRDFETGSVIIEAVVDTSGDVISMNVLSGPPSLRKPAMDAIKNYKYEPATRNGRPVPARVSVKIQFHFE